MTANARVLPPGATVCPGNTVVGCGSRLFFHTDEAQCIHGHSFVTVPPMPLPSVHSGPFKNGRRL
jgi:hypothetical protein